MNTELTFNKYLSIAIIYFFLNGLLFINGLLLTTLMTPLLLYTCISKKSINYLIIGAVILICVLPFHATKGLNVYLYIKSLIGFLSVAAFCMAVSYFANNCSNIPQIFKKIVILNTWMLPLAFLALTIPVLKPYFWYNNPITTGISSFERLKMLTYEPSYYATLWAPIVLFYLCKALFFPSRKIVGTLILITIPLLLSLSFGVLASLFISTGSLLIFYYKPLLTPFKRKQIFIRTVYLLFILLIVIAILFPENVIFLRAVNVLSGKDISFNGRTSDSLVLACQIASEKSIWFGVGPGQVKLLGLEHFKEFYNVSNFTINEIGIPNAVADTLATFGIFGLIIRFSLQIYFFISTNTAGNAYRLCLFIFAFIYQFTGSFITNIAEYVIWVLAFTPGLFSEFNKSSFKIFHKFAK